ncbi:ATP-dependent Lon protease [Aminivibrio pyruvatiphilus]|uniref:ATP-dependent Lon protease n=1 Tax=Aminivibrio pyruvatiphilus TaxID=1005740 RepID=A0A4V3HGM5_9BACT|nr:BREX system Lon protease-like protein BrxL [Aminivibrio pyruvatiphilus]TDY61881.1 ATP-dependent Lon protease [Aminivibrio pyruvatiphilus]
MLEDKIKSIFSEMIVLKDPKKTEFFSNLSLPSYMRDWLVMKFSDESGVIDFDSVLRYIKKYIPGREDFEQFKYAMVNGEKVRFLARIRVMVDIKDGKTVFELPDFGGSRTGASGVVESDVVKEWQDVLLRENENWGVLDFMWNLDYSKKPPKGCIRLVNYKPFCPYTVDLDYYRKARKEFSIQEWIDVLLSAVDYNPKGYVDDVTGAPSESKKLFFLQRLLPFVENRINLIELAPKGTGKSYVYEKISKRGWLVSGGTVSRAALVYDNQKKMSGLLSRFDYVGFDESQSIKFDQPSQIQAALKHYMEFGEIKGFDAQVVANAGVIVLGNIDAERFDVNKNMVAEINPIFQESATLDRFHGFIPGWKIPRLNQDIIAHGWALNTEYFAEVLHALRNELVYSAVVDQCISVPRKADKRDLTAIKRLCTAFLKLLFPHVGKKSDISKEEFVKYCLEPAKSMRQIIRTQLCIVDPKEYDVSGKRDIPDIQYDE